MPELWVCALVSDVAVRKEVVDGSTVQTEVDRRKYLLGVQGGCRRFGARDERQGRGGEVKDERVSTGSWGMSTSRVRGLIQECQSTRWTHVHGHLRHVRSLSGNMLAATT